jgi:hypothetical protein
MNIKQLPSLASFEDKRITSGLKYILGGTAVITKTEGGHMSEEAGGHDYVCDAYSGGSKTYGLCRNHATAADYYASQDYTDWVASLN